MSQIKRFCRNFASQCRSIAHIMAVQSSRFQVWREPMKIGVPKEIKNLEFRVGMTPAGVNEVIHDGHEVIVQTDAGAGIGVTDADYEAVGATVVGTAEEV